MSNDRHPSEDADVIVFLDANMPNVKECRHGCCSDPDRMCLHRFGPHIWICDRPNFVQRPGAPQGTAAIPFGRLRDPEVVLWCISTVRRRWADARGIVRKKHYVLATHDKTFLEDVKTQYGRGKAHEEFPLSFSDGWADMAHGKRCWIQSGCGDHAVRLEVLMLNGGFRDRNHDIRLLLCCTNELRRDASAPVP